MSNLSSFLGGEKTPTSVVNGYSTNGWATTSFGSTIWAKSVLTGACTAATLKTILSITGAGQLNFVGIRTGDATARTVRVRITLDGVVAIDTTSASISTSGVGAPILGMIDPSASPNGWPAQTASFASSCLIEFASSLTETDKCNFFLAYKVY